MFMGAGGGSSIDDQIAGAGVSSGGGGGGLQADDPPVFVRWGGRDGSEVITANERAGSVRRRPDMDPKKRGTQSVAVTRGMSEVADEWYEWEDVDRQKWAQHLIDVGVIDEEDRYDYSKLQELWGAMVQESAGFTAHGRQVSPWDAARLFGGGDESGKTAGSLGRGAVGEEGPVQRYTQSSRTRNVDVTDPMTAKALVNQVLGKLLGRNANDDEIRALTNTLNDAERDNPRVTDTTTKYTLRDDETGYDTVTTSKTHGGIDAGQVLSDEAMDDEEYGAYQAATTYWGALEAALGTIAGN